MRLPLPLGWFCRPALLPAATSRCLSAVASAAVDSALPSRVHAALERNIGLSTGQTLVVSVSGGCDSVALLRLLVALQPRWRLRLHVLHFNHGLRSESVDEEAFVRAMAAEHELPIHVRRLPPGWQDSAPGGIQVRSREWRHEHSLALLEELDLSHAASTANASQGGGIDTQASAGSHVAAAAAPSAVDDAWPAAESLVALGHHADDQELVQMGGRVGVG